eukprot:365258-Chlamydomonas_euryale.AAC.3
MGCFAAGCGCNCMVCCLACLRCCCLVDCCCVRRAGGDVAGLSCQTAGGCDAAPRQSASAQTTACSPKISTAIVCWSRRTS